MNMDRAYSMIGKIRAGLRKQTIPFMVFLLLFMIMAGYLYQSIFYTIMPGEAGVHWKRFGGGTVVDYIYPEGMHIIPPFDRMYIYNVRLQEIPRELFALTNTGLQVRVELSIRYAPKYKLLGLLHQKVGPDYASTVIVPEIENVLREVIGGLGAEEIYTTGRAVIIEAINKAIERVAQRYIDVDSVLIRRIEMPESVAKVIRYKTEQKHMIEAQQFKVKREEHEAERKRIEGQGIRDQLNIISAAIPEGDILKWMGINATLELAKSSNAKVIVIGAGKSGLPLIGTVPMDNEISSSDSPALLKELLPENSKNSAKTETTESADPESGAPEPEPPAPADTASASDTDKSPADTGADSRPPGAEAAPGASQTPASAPQSPATDDDSF